jgi:hypothetical protein
MLKAVDSEGADRRLLYTEVTAYLDNGQTFVGIDGPTWEGTRTLRGETERFSGLCNNGAWFSTANGVIFNPEKIMVIDIDLVPVETGERQEA